MQVTFPVVESWRFGANDVANIMKLANKFSDSRLQVKIDTNGMVTVDYESGVPKKPVLFCGLTVDIESGWVYATKIPDINCCKLGVVNDLFREFIGRAVSRDEAISAIEKFKLTGSLSKMFDQIDTTGGGSMIASSVNAVMTEGKVIKSDRVTAFLNNVSAYYKSFHHLIKAMKEKYPQYPEVEKDLWSYDRNFSETNDKLEIPKRGSVDEVILLASTPAYVNNQDKGLLLYGGRYPKQAILASNVVEICDAMDKGDEVVLSTDLKGRLKNAGFDRILSSREMTSVSANPEFVRTLSRQSISNADNVKVATDVTQNSWHIDPIKVRNSIKGLSKVIVKITSAKEVK